MTEAEWLSCQEPGEMLRFLRGGIVALVDDLPTQPAREAVRQLLQSGSLMRKVRLYACNCCRIIWTILTDERSRTAVEVAERYLDGQATAEELETARFAAHAARNAVQPNRRRDPGPSSHIARVAADAVWEAVSFSLAAASQEIADVATWVGVRPTLEDAKADQAARLRDVVGNPFRPVFVDTAWLLWRGGIVLRLAQTIYDERRFEELPILADALEDAGCDHAAILDHCRTDIVHVRGCWVVDLLLGKD